MAGDPACEGHHIGPLFDRLQWDRVQMMIVLGIEGGTRLGVGGPGWPADLKIGWYVRPTAFAEVTNDMTIAREEIFRPVPSILRAEDEAIRLANDTPYGLAAVVQAGDSVRVASESCLQA